MRALVPSPASGDNTKLVEMADVDAPTAGRGEVLIDVEAFSVNRGELSLLGDPRPDWRPGQDLAGTVVTSRVNGLAPGTRVAALADWEAWAEQVAVPASRVAPIPDHMSMAQAAALPLAGVTALRLLRRAGSMLGVRMLVTGAAGGVGHIVTELATNAGALVTVVTRSEERGAVLADLGAAAVVHDVDDADGPFDVVLESVAGAQFTAALRKTAPGGLILWYGRASGPTITVPFADAMASHGVRIEVFSHHYTPAARDDDVATLVRLVADGRLHVEIGRQESWAQTNQVLADLRDRRIRGKAVLLVD